MSDSLPAGPQVQLDTTVPHSARIWNYLLGGKDNFAPDRAVGDQVKEHLPEIVAIAQAGRSFLERAVQHLVQDARIRQFLDLGTGLPTANNTHQIAQHLAPKSRIVYVDNDPLVLVHARALLISTPEGVTAYIDADVGNTDAVLAKARETLDFGEPVAVMMLGILGHVPDDQLAAAIVAQVMGAVPSGSYLVVNDSIDTPANAAAIQVARSGGADYRLRSPAQIAEFLTGLEVVEPGVVSTPRWRPEPDATAGEPPELDVYCGVARKP